MAYYLEGDTCPIRDWYDSQDIPVQAEFDVTLGTLAATEDWTDTKVFQELKRQHAGLGEIRFTLEELRLRQKYVRRFRPVGIWPPIVENEFILLLGCEKERGVYIPPDPFTLALNYRQRFLDGRGRIDDYL
jgi:hypothetical protein